MIQKLRIGFLTAFAVMCFVSVSWGYGTTFYTFKGVSGTQSFKINPGRNEVTFSPNKTGSWWFKAWHTSLIGVSLENPPVGQRIVGCANVFTFWRDGSKPWNEWPGGGIACYYLCGFDGGRTLLYSGKKSIAYKFVFFNYDYFSVDMKISLEKL